MEIKGEIAIIGAGVSGLAAAKSLLEVGLKPLLFEKSNKLGGLWNYGKKEGSPLYLSLKTNISKQMMGFSDFPFPEANPDFPSHKQVIDYLRKYTKKHDLEKFISYDSQVVDVEFVEDRYRITVRKNGLESAYSVEKLIIAAGRFDVPNIPPINGLESFTGELIHSKEYDTSQEFKNKSVLIVGTAASAMDIGSELYGIAKRVNLSFRNMPWVIPPIINDKPADHALTWLKAKLPKGIREKGFSKILLKEYIKRGAPKDMKEWSFVAPAVDLEKTRFVPNEKMIPLLIEKKVLLYPAIKEIKGNEITFEDGRTDSSDVIILATGYKTEYPFLSRLVQVENNYIGLYKQIFHPDYPSLTFVAAANIVGAAFTLIEMQSRYIAQVFSGNIALPSLTFMKEEIRKHKAYCDEKALDPMRVQALDYLDRIAQLIRLPLENPWRGK